MQVHTVAICDFGVIRTLPFKAMEGHIRTLGMEVLFHYKPDGRGIFRGDLWEGSLIPIPANPDALFAPG